MADAVGERIKRLRRSRNLSLRQLAEAAKVPVSTLSAIESGERFGRNLTLETGKRLARALGISLDVIAGVYDEEELESKIKAAVQAWIEARTCTADDVLSVEGIMEGVYVIP